jgi:RimJ/RimL family protein N-acetyltransferase
MRPTHETVYAEITEIVMTIHFEKANKGHIDFIFKWLQEPHMMEFWDNSQEHKDDILNFVNNRKEPSHYFHGIFTYWIGFYNHESYALIMTSEVIADQACPPLWESHLSSTGKTITLDFGIGNKKYLGKGLAAPTLKAFMIFYKQEIDSEADTFFIDPDDNNPRARHVYFKAGFVDVGTFQAPKAYWEFSGKGAHLMVKKI